MAEPGTGDGSGQGMSTPRGRGAAMGRRIPSSLSPGRLPTMRSRDLTLGGVKKVGLMKDYLSSESSWSATTYRHDDV
jgi:hypothetical protein